MPVTKRVLALKEEYTENKATVDGIMRNVTYTISPDFNGFYHVTISKGKVPQHFRGRFTSIQKAFAAIETYESSLPRQSDKAIERDIKAGE